MYTSPSVSLSLIRREPQLNCSKWIYLWFSTQLQQSFLRLLQFSPKDNLFFDWFLVSSISRVIFKEGRQWILLLMTDRTTRPKKIWLLTVTSLTGKLYLKPLCQWQNGRQNAIRQVSLWGSWRDEESEFEFLVCYICYLYSVFVQRVDCVRLGRAIFLLVMSFVSYTQWAPYFKRFMLFISSPLGGWDGTSDQGIRMSYRIYPIEYTRAWDDVFAWLT